MPYELELPRRLKARGWKVKIREKERLDPPHLTIQCKKRQWRVGLRDGAFLVPPGGSWKDIEPEVTRIIQQQWMQLQEQWDRKYPSNPIASEDDEEDR